VDAVRLAHELLDAISHVHAAGIVHRDVKPANVLFDRDGRVHLTDFGIARTMEATKLTQTGVVIGTLRYLAPEVMAGEPATAASDLYATGKVIDEASSEAGCARLRPLIGALTDEHPGSRPASAEAALRLLEKTVPTVPLATGPSRLAPDASAPRGGRDGAISLTRDRGRRSLRCRRVTRRWIGSSMRSTPP
jgi:eukaryotic-like serine/threonine-protein kinase